MFELVIFAFLPFFYMFGMLLISTFVLWLIMKILKKIKMSQVKNIDKTMNYREIPCFGEIKVAYWLLYNYSNINKSTLNNGLFSAYLLSWYKNGYIDVKITKSFGLFKNNYSIDLKNGTFAKDNSEARLFSFFRSAAKTNNLLEKNEIKEYCSLDENRSELRRTLEFILKDAEADLVKNNLLKVTPAKDFILFRIPAKYELSEDLLNEYQNLVGLENFLKDYSNMEEKKLVEVHLWEEYLIFANLFGIADKVKEQFKKICPETNSLSKAFEPSFDDSFAGRIGMMYQMTKLQLVSYIIIFLIMAISFFGGASFVKLIAIVFMVVLLIGSVYYPLKKYLTNKKVKEMYSMAEAKITDYMAHQHEEYDSETGRTTTVITYTFDYEFYVNEVPYKGHGRSEGFFKPKKGKKIKIYFNRDNPYESETKAEHNKYLKTALFIGTIITLTLVLIKFSLT